MKRHLNTDFRKFILEKLNRGKRKNNNEDELVEVEPDDEIGYDDIGEVEPDTEEPIEDEEPEDGEGLGDDVIDELLNEYKKIKKKHDLYKLHKRK